MVSPVKAQESPKKEKRGAKPKARKAKKEKKVKKEGEEGAKRRKKADYSSYSRFIHKLIRGDKKKAQVRITSRGMAIVNSFVVDLFERLAGEAGRLASHANVKTLSSKAVIAAVKMQLPKGLAEHALGAGATAVASYSKSTGSAQKKSSSKK
eukprot:TRINITY_DN1054_c1_g5_i1.p2 TRINITY_DN1054_c1_g5~~TRINITY_DN1054_c1_g5_i1.p2  ORF type:complete len:171 (+),score=82.80 TRINITY_DN1054_c1_g5_i1:58-513(+)